ncbi:MAG: PCRF domain-containing protein, partial [Planctomycetota bacterium]
MIAETRLQDILDRHAYLEARLAELTDPAEIATASRDYAALRDVVDAIEHWRTLTKELEEARAMAADPEMAALARDEIAALEAALPEAEQALQLALLPKDAADERAAILEIRPGTGGDEAALFAGDLFAMYRRYAERRGWRVEVLE